MTDEEYRQLMESSPQKAQRALFDEYFPYVFAIVAGRLRSCASREDVDECTADVFSEVFLYLDRASSHEGELRGIVGTIARNRSIDAFRRLSGKSGMTVPLEEALDRPSPQEGPLDQAERRELRQILLRKIGELGSPDSTIVLESYFFGRTSKEIGRSLSMTPAAVRMRLSRAMKKLREMLEKEDITL
ncbi:MAG: sigma-70 family RNA polymerase sigma factor [Ruminococcus sp.]|nr:sigma-70 family RNA polymerase sigma factor [Ruminococcus sp.]